MLKNFLTYVILSTVLFFATGAAFAEDFTSVTGKWYTQDDKTGEMKSLIELYVANDGSLEGKILKMLKEPGKRCYKCPGESIYAAGTPYEGMKIIWGVQKLNAKSGYILSPGSAKIYNLRISREGNTLKVRGYIGIIYRTQTWVLAQ